MWIMSSTKKVCPRTGWSPWRRKKNCLALGISVTVFYAFMQMVHFDDGYTALRPLFDAKSEARRLHKWITHYQYQCNTTIQVGNRTQWPICTEPHAGVDVDSRDSKVAYSVGPFDFKVETMLAQNNSFQVYVIAQEKNTKSFKNSNTTHVMNTNLVANDPADFSRNSYGQNTLNDIMKSLGHNHIDILHLVTVGSSVQMWELVHFMNYDNLIMKVQQLHLAMYIDKLDEDFLYSWYRVLHDLYYKEGMRLYHTSSRDSLCLQVTMMQSCVYYLSFVRNPGPRVFVLHPPADYGSPELEEKRLLDFITTPAVECKQLEIGGPNDQTLHFTSPSQPHWFVCVNSVYQTFQQPCTVFRFRESNDHVLEERFIQEGCSVFTVEPVQAKDGVIKTFHIHSHLPKGRGKPKPRHVRPMEDVLQLMAEQKELRLVELDLPTHSWPLLTQLLDTGALENVTQIVANLQLPDITLGLHPTVLRTRYSELRRLESQNFHLFSSVPIPAPMAYRHRTYMQENCCFKVGFVKKEQLYR